MPSLNAIHLIVYEYLKRQIDDTDRRQISQVQCVDEEPSKIHITTDLLCMIDVCNRYNQISDQK